MRNEHLTPRDTPLAPGDTAPRFTLADHDRNEWSLDEHLGNGDVVLAFYPLDFTGVCSDEMSCLTSELARFAGAEAEVVGISCDSFAAHAAFREKLGLKHTLLADMHREVCKAYGLYWADLNVSSRGTVVIGPDGVVKWAQSREPGNAFDLDELLATLA